MPGSTDFWTDVLRRTKEAANAADTEEEEAPMSEATDVDISPLEFTVDVEQPVDDGVHALHREDRHVVAERDALDRRGPRRRA